MNKEKIFIEDVSMETQTTFYANGNINIYPCGFELGQHIVSGSKIAVQRGRMETEDDGTSHFVPYRSNSGSRYRRLFATDHGEVKSSKTSIIFCLKFPIKMNPAKMVKAITRETLKMAQYVATLNNRNSHE